VREKKIHELILKWVGSFISNQTTTLCLPGNNTDAFLTYIGIPHGSTLSPNLFFLNNAYFVDTCNLPTLPAYWIGFDNDMNTLALGKTTEDHCRMLQSLDERCLELARRHWASFAPDKFILVHFTKVTTMYNTACQLTLPSFTINPSPFACVFGDIHEENSAGTRTCNTLGPSWQLRPTSS
jgi:hypothetical protein